MPKNDQVLDDKQIHEIKKLVAETRRFFDIISYATKQLH